MRSVKDTMNVYCDTSVAVSLELQRLLTAATKMSRQERLSLSRGVSDKYNCEEAGVFI